MVWGALAGIGWTNGQTSGGFIVVAVSERMGNRGLDGIFSVDIP